MTLNFATTPENLQLQSPLFGVLPGEVRNEIFELALMQYEDETELYPEDSYWYRPGFCAPRKSNSTLLQTCKMAYAEGQKVFLRELEWAFWFDRGPDGRTGNESCRAFFDKLTPHAVHALQKVRFFTQMYWLENDKNLSQLLSMPNFRPAEITITIRYSDWWWWESNAPLTMETGWLSAFRGNPGLRQLRIEYEQLVWKKNEMMRIVERNKKYKLPVLREGNDEEGDNEEGDNEEGDNEEGDNEEGDNEEGDNEEGDNEEVFEGYLSAENTAITEWKWRGTSRLGGETWEHHGKGETVEYVVVTDTWVFVEQNAAMRRAD